MNETKCRLGKRISPSWNTLSAYYSCGCVAHCLCDNTSIPTQDNTFSIDYWNSYNLDLLLVNAK